MMCTISHSDDQKGTMAATGHRYHLNEDEKQKRKSVNIKNKDAQFYIRSTTTHLLERDSTEKSPLYVILSKKRGSRNDLFNNRKSFCKIKFLWLIKSGRDHLLYLKDCAACRLVFRAHELLPKCFFNDWPR